MMNRKAFEKRLNRDISRAKKDLAALSDDIIGGLSGRFGRIRLTNDQRKSASEAVKSINKSIGQGLNQYNTTVQDVIDRVPGDISKKVTGYPWVTITMTLLLGLLVGGLLRFSRHM